MRRDDDGGCDVLIPAGGAARRLGGVDKPALRVGGTPLLDRVLAATAGTAGRTVVVGPPRPTGRPVRWVREQPPGGGPVAALAAGLAEVAADRVLVLAADLPFLDRSTVGALLGGLASKPGAAAALLVDADGRDQPLAAAYRTGTLRAALAAAVAERGGGDPAGLPVRAVLERLPAGGTVRVADRTGAAFDCDTWADVRAARGRHAAGGRIREHGGVLDDWIAAAKTELGIDLDVDVRGLLDMTKEVAHGVARPAAPLTAFLVGYAAASRGGGAEAVDRANARIEALAARWSAERPDPDAAEPGAGGPDGGGPDARGPGSAGRGPGGEPA